MRAYTLLFGLLAAWPGLAHAQVPLRPSEDPSPPPPPAAEAPVVAPQPPPPVEPASAPPPVAPAAPPVAPSTADTSAPEPAQPDRAPAPANRPTSGADADTRRFSGGSFALQLVMAGRTGKKRTLAFGGAYLHDQVFALSSKDEVVDGDEPSLDNVSMALWLLGFFVDVAMQPEPGLHFQAIAGFGGMNVVAPSRDTDDPFGLAFNLGVGYDLSVGRYLSLGALLRTTVAPLDVDESQGTTVTSLAPSLLLTATTR